MGFTMDANIRELKAHLSKYVRLAEAGEAVNVLSRGKVVAQLVAAPAQDETDAKRLSRLPWVRMGRPGAKLGLDKPIALRGPGPSLTEILHADRE